MSLSTGANDSAALAEADVLINSTDGKLTFAVVHDSVVMQLSDSVREFVKSRVDSSLSASSAEGGIGGTIARMVSGTVNKAVRGAMGFALRSPASAVTDLRYEQGRLYFKVDGGNMKFSTHGTGSNDGAPFAEDDARRFIEAVMAAQSRQSTK